MTILDATKTLAFGSFKVEDTIRQLASFLALRTLADTVRSAYGNGDGDYSP